MTRRVVVHDFSGHPFQLQLSRELARRGDEVLHLHCSSYVSGKGETASRPGDAPSLTLDSIDLGKPFDRYHVRERRAQELAYSRLAIDRIERFAPDVLISCNVPLFAHGPIQKWAQSNGIAFVFWHQDFYGTAIREQAARRIPYVGDLAGRWFERTERRLLERSDAVIGISPDFAHRYRAWGIAEERFTIIENWAPVHELVPEPRDNQWSREHGLADTTNLLYSGTLGLKHNPSLLTALAVEFADDSHVRVVVVSEGSGAEWLAQSKDRDGLDNLVLLPYQPYEALPSVIGSGDALVAILEPGAGTFSVPSKVLSYLCAARPVIAAMPDDNLATDIIRRAGAGVVVDVHDVAGFVAAARALIDDPDTRRQMGLAARTYAEKAFDIVSIADQFDEIIGGICSVERTTSAPLPPRSTS